MALSDRRVAQTLLEFKIARGELEQARRGLASLADGYEELDEIARDTDRIIAKGTSGLARYAQTTKGQTVPSIRELRTAIDEAAEAQERLNEGQSKGIRLLPGANLRPNVGGGGNSQGLRPLGSAARAASGLGLGGAAQGLNVADDLLDAGRALVQLGPAGALAAGAMVAMGVAIDHFTKQIEAGKQGLSGALTAQTAYYQALQSGTVESITEQLKAFNSRRTFLQEQINETQSAIDETFAQAAATFGDAAARALDAAGQLPTAQLREQLQLLETEMQTNVQTSDRLTVALDSTEVATRAANEAFLELTKAQQEFTDRILNVQIRTLIQTTSLTTEAIEQRLEAIDREQEVLQEFIAAGNLSAEATEELRLRLADLGVEEMTLAAQVADVVAAAEIAADKEKRRTDALLEAGEALVKTRDEIKKIEGEIDKINDGLAAKIAELAAARVEAETKALVDKNETIAEAEKDAADERAEAAAEQQKAREKVEVDHQKRIRDIIRQFNRSAEQAIQDRDAVALDAAQRARDDALEDEKESYDERQKEINERLKETNKAIDKRLQEQRDNAIKRYNEQLQAAAAHERKQLELARAAAIAEIQQRQQALAVLKAQEQAFLAASLGMQKNFWQAALQLASNAVKAIQGATLGSGKPVPNAGGTPPKLPNVPPKFASGADVYRSGLAIVHAGEKILNPQQQAASMGGLNIPINITADRKEKIIREVMTRLSDALDEVA